MVILYVSTCITRGTDPCMAASDGRTPFYVACAEGHIDIVKLLHVCAQIRWTCAKQIKMALRQPTLQQHAVILKSFNTSTSKA